MSVIDHKALWRANLYISEQSSDDNPVVDWNNENPWDAHPDYKTNPESAPWWWDESYGVNDWQESQAYHTPAGTVAGGQVIRFSGFSSILGGNRDDRVAYEYPITYGSPEKWHGAVDTPIEFQQHMESQRDSFAQWYAPAPLGLGNSTPAGLTNQKQLQLPTWNATSAPVDNWLYYVPGQWGNFPSSVNNLLDKPYLPGLGLVTLEDGPPAAIVLSGAQVDTMKGQMTSGETLRWAQLMTGVDCIGFAQRVFDYPEDLYTWGTLGPDGIYRAYPRAELDKSVHPKGGTWEVYSELIVGKVGEADVDVSLYRLIKPGDILYTRLNNGSGRHIAIVQSVERNPDGSVSAGNIRLIEAFYDRAYAFVVNPGIEDVSRTLTKYENDTWRIVRLKTRGTN
ncbi:hypothetical protein [Spirochaeta lutea]|nr:hypothetical protein [Spirochaeta lutea]